MSYNPMRGEAAVEADAGVGCVRRRGDLLRVSLPRHAARTGSGRPSAGATTSFSDDWVGVSLDSSRAGQLAYHLFVNPSGIQMDALQSGSNGEDFAPDWVWQSAGHVDADGWSAEIRVPLENIRFRSGADVRMGVLFWRRLSRTGVSTSWPEMRARPMGVRVERGGRVRQAAVAAPARSDPERRRSRAIRRGTTESRVESHARAKAIVGASVKYGITSAVTLDATVNPDFSQVESDAFEVEVNQRFPVFFSEKRPFFMEGLGLFNIAGTGGDATMRTAVHTRRIIDPSAGLKLTGAAGRHTFGVLSSADASSGGRRASDCSRSAREVMNFGRGQYAGLLLTDTEYGTDSQSRRRRRRRVQAGRALPVNGSFLSSHSRSLTGETSKGIGAQGSYFYSTRRFASAGSSSTTIAGSGWTRRSSTASA